MDQGQRQVKFSGRTNWDRGASAMAQAIAAARARNIDLLDLTSSNPTACGLDLAGLFGAEPMAPPEAMLRYEPDPLFWDPGGGHGWWIDFAELEREVGPRTRAIVVVHPNNPTGHATSAAERDQLRGVCARHGLALIVDEVFLDYAIEPHVRLTSFAAEQTPVLTVVLSGLSKVAALPGMKLGWMVVLGPEAEQAEARARLEIVADTFLSVGTPAQVGMERWMRAAPAVQAAVLRRVRENLAILQRAGVDVLPVEAGWSAVVRLPRTFSAPDAAAALLAHSVIGHPGSFYGMAEVGRVVLSLLTPVATMKEAARRVVKLD